MAALSRCWASTVAPDGRSTSELLAKTGQTSMADLLRRHRVRWPGHTARNS